LGPDVAVRSSKTIRRRRAIDVLSPEEMGLVLTKKPAMVVYNRLQFCVQHVFGIEQVLVCNTISYATLGRSQRNNEYTNTFVTRVAKMIQIQLKEFHERL